MNREVFSGFRLTNPGMVTTLASYSELVASWGLEPEPVNTLVNCLEQVRIDTD